MVFAIPWQHNFKVLMKGPLWPFLVSGCFGILSKNIWNNNEKTNPAKFHVSYANGVCKYL